MQTFRTNDSRTLSYTLKGAGPLVVMLPGGPGLDPKIYFGDLDLPGYELLIFNPRGTGASDFPATPDGYRLAGYVEDLEALYQHVGAKQLCIYGSSHGATTALAYAAAHPGNVHSLILASGPAKMDLAFIRDLDQIHQQFELSTPDGAGRLNGSRQAGPRMRSATTDQERRSAMRTMMDTYIACPSSQDSAFLDRLAAAPLNFAAPAIMAEEMITGLDLMTEAPKITARTIVLGGDLDVRVPPQHLEEVAKVIPGARFHRFPGRGHLLHIEAPQEWARVVSGFLNEGDNENIEPLKHHHQ